MVSEGREKREQRKDVSFRRCNESSSQVLVELTVFFRASIDDSRALMRESSQMNSILLREQSFCVSVEGRQFEKKQKVSSDLNVSHFRVTPMPSLPNYLGFSFEETKNDQVASRQRSMSAITSNPRFLLDLQYLSLAFYERAITISIYSAVLINIPEHTTPSS